MAASACDRNLLFGILALQMDFILRDQLVAAMHAWVLDKATPLSQILRNQNALSAEHLVLLEAMVAAHLAQHASDPQISLQAVSSVSSLVAELKQVADPDVQASISLLAAPRADDPYATRTFSAGTSTAQGTRFRIVRPHARGGLGEVFVAYDEELRREVALKEIQTRHAESADSRARFVQEAEVTGGLEHPGIVPVYGLGHYADGRPFYAMRFIKGGSLQDAIRRYHHVDGSRDAVERSVEQRKLLRRFFDVCNAIEYAHSRGVLHRDLKPGNIMLGQYGETLVVDWGLAKAGVTGQRSEGQGSPAQESLLRPGPGSSNSETMPGSALGTPAFMSPEQAAGRLDQLGPASDIYCLGATLYALLTGKPPFASSADGDILARVQQGDFPRPRQIEGDIHPALEAICLKAMALCPANRYPTVAALAKDIVRWLDDQPVSAWPEPFTVRTRRWMIRHRTIVTASVAAVLVAVVSLGITAFLLGSKNQELTQLNGHLIIANDAEKKAKADAVTREIEVTALNVDLVHANAAEKKAREDALVKEQEARKSEADAKAQRQFADAQTKLAQKALAVARMRHQAARISLAHRDWEANQAAEAWYTLDHQSPVDGPPLHGWEYWHLRGLFESNQTILHVDSSGLGATALSANGNYFAGMMPNHVVGVWDIGANLKPRLLKGHTKQVLAIAFSGNGKRLATASEDGSTRIWDRAQNQQLLVLKGNAGRSLTITFDGRRVAGATDNAVLLWDLDKSPEPITLTGHTKRVLAVAFNADGSRLASRSLDSTVRVWEVEKKQPPLVFKAGLAINNHLTFSPDSKHLAGAAADNAVQLWDLDKGLAPLLFKGHTGQVNHVVFSPNSKHLASAAGDRTVRLWQVAKGQELFVLTGHAAQVVALAFSPDDKRVASAAMDGTMRLWDVSTGRELRVLKGHKSNVLAMAFLPDGKRLASASSDRTVRLWDLDGAQRPLRLTGHTNSVFGVIFSPDGQWLVSASFDNTIRLWDVNDGKQRLCFDGYRGMAFQGTNGSVFPVAFSPDSRQLAISDGTSVRLLDVHKPAEPRMLHGHTHTVLAVAFSPDGKRLASASDDKTVRLWNMDTGHGSQVLTGHADAVIAVAFSPNGKYLASASNDKTVRLWDTQRQEASVVLTGHTHTPAFGLIFSPDSTWLTSTSSDLQLIAWNVANLKVQLPIDGHGPIVFSPKGNQIAYARSERVELRDYTSGKWTELQLEGHYSRSTSLVFSPDGSRLVSAFHNKVMMWDADTGVQTMLFKGPTEQVNSLAFSRDGTRLACALADGSVWIWDAPGAAVGAQVQ